MDVKSLQEQLFRLQAKVDTLVETVDILLQGVKVVDPTPKPSPPPPSLPSVLPSPLPSLPPLGTALR